MGETNYKLLKPLTFVLVRANSCPKFTWELRRGKTLVARSAELFDTAVTARRSIERAIDNMRRNPMAPRIVEEL